MKKGDRLLADPPKFVWFRSGLLGGLRHRENRNKGALLEALVEFDLALGSGKDGVILAHVYIVTRVPLGATLADDDVAGDNFLAAKFFDAKTLAA